MSYDTTPTIAIYQALQDAYDYFNRELFNGLLPDAMIVLHRKRNALGYFWAGMWQAVGPDSAQLDEISLTPESLQRGDRDVLSTLVHEMVHLWQQHFGKPSRNAYHNRQWAEQMKAVGLQPVAVGPNAKPDQETGQNCTHTIITGGRFDRSAAIFLADREVINWYGLSTVRVSNPKKNKVKYQCSCGNNVWGRSGLAIACEDCEESYKEI